MKRRDTPSSYARGLIEAAVANGKGRSQWATAVTIWPFLDVAAVNYGRYIMDVLPGKKGGQSLLDEVVDSMVQRLSSVTRQDLIQCGDVPLVTAVVGPIQEATEELASYVVKFQDGRTWRADSGPISDVYFDTSGPKAKYKVSSAHPKACPDAVWRSVRMHCFAKEQHAFIDRLFAKEMAA